MFKRLLLASAVALSLTVTAAIPAKADVAITYPDWISSLIDPGIAAFEKETGQKVTAIKVPFTGYVERVNLDLAAGTASDVVVIDSFVVSELASSGYLLALDDRAKNWDQFQYYSKGLIDVVSYGGHVYALPTDTDVRMLWYNKDVFAKAGIAMPWTPKTWDDVLKTAETVKAKTGIEDAFVLPAGTKQEEGTTMQGFYMALLGADVPEGDRNRLRDRANGKWIGDSPAIRRTLQFYQDVYVKNKLATSAINYSADFNAINAAMIAGKIGILASGSWENTCLWGCGNANMPSQEDRDKVVGWTPWPGSGLPGTKATTNISGGWTVAIAAKAKDPDMAFKLLTAIFDRKLFEDWTVKERKMAVRSDIATSAAYTADPYLAQATALANDTTGRDTFPGYQKVSALVQQATGDILDGKSVDDVVKEYHDALVDEFGADNVVTIQ